MKHMRFFVGLLWFTLVPLVCAATTSRPVLTAEPQVSHAVDIPLRYDPILCPRLLVRVSLNNAVPLSFIVDTGSNVGLVVDKWAADQVGLKATGDKFKTERGVIMDITNIQKFRLLTSEQDALAGYSVPVNQAVIANLNYPADLVPGTRIAGLVGLPALKYGNQAIRFDLVSHTLTLFAHEPPPVHGAGTEALPLKEEDNQYFVKASGDKGSAIDMLVDTGAEFVYAPATLLNNFALVPTPLVYEARMFNEGVRSVQVYQAAQLALGTLIEPNVVVHVGSRDKALLGLPVLERFRFTMDFVRKQLLLERAFNYAAQSLLPGATAIQLERQKEAVQVDRVVKDTTAERAGVQQGDEILEVDHIAVQKLPLSVVQNLLDGFANTTADVTLRRTGKVQTVMFLRQSLFAFASGAPIGIGINAGIDPKGRMIVSNVIVHSSAEEAGIKEGDEILAVNGLVVGKVPIADLSKQTHQPEGTEVVLKLQREGEDKPREVKLKVRKLL